MKKVLVILFILLISELGAQSQRWIDADGTVRKYWKIGGNGAGEIRWNNDSTLYYLRWKEGVSYDSAYFLLTKSPSVAASVLSSSVTYYEGDALPPDPRAGDWLYWTGESTGGMIKGCWYRFGGTAWVKKGLNGTYIGASGLYTGTLYADQVIAGTLTGITIQTSESGQRVVIDGGDNIRFYKTDGSLVSSLYANAYSTLSTCVLEISSDVKGNNFYSTSFVARNTYSSGDYLKTVLSSNSLKFVDTYSSLDITVGAHKAVDNYEPVLTVAGADVATRNWVNNRGYLTSIPSNVDAAKIANGSVNNIEFQYLDGLNGRIIDLLANKVDVSSSYNNPGWLSSLAFSKITGFVTSGGTSSYYVATSSGGSPTTPLNYYMIDGRKFLYVP